MNNELPSNFTIDEIIKYGNLSEQAVKVLEQMQSNLEGLEEENDEYRKKNNQLSDKLYHCKNLLNLLWGQYNSATKSLHLVADILPELKNADIEL
jgi:uncharacterized protein YoxC